MKLKTNGMGHNEMESTNLIATGNRERMAIYPRVPTPVKYPRRVL